MIGMLLSVSTAWSRTRWNRSYRPYTGSLLGGDRQVSNFEFEDFGTFHLVVSIELKGRANKSYTLRKAAHAIYIEIFHL